MNIFDEIKDLLTYSSRFDTYQKLLIILKNTYRYNYAEREYYGSKTLSLGMAMRHTGTMSQLYEIGLQQIDHGRFELSLIHTYNITFATIKEDVIEEIESVDALAEQLMPLLKKYVEYIKNDTAVFI